MDERITGLGTWALLAFAPSAGARTDPDKPIRLIVAFPPGGGADLSARAIAQRLTERWRQQVIADNRAGAGGVTGTEVVRRWNTAAVEMHREPEFAERLSRRGIEPSTSSPEAFGALIREEHAR